jgi:hypothetical protein
MSDVLSFTRAQMTQNAWESSLDDRADIQAMSAQLVKLYEGSQMAYVWAYLGKLLKNPRIRARYQELAVFRNIVRLLVDRVSTLGQLPVRVLWKNEANEWDTVAQGLWDEISTERMGEKPWDSVVPTIARRTELCKTCVAGAEWDDYHGGVDVRTWTPNVIDVGYAEGNARATQPDIWYLLLGEETDWWQRWDFTSRTPGPSGFVVDCTRDGKEDGDRIPLVTIDPKTGRSLVPFVTFRTRNDDHEFFVRDGQEEVIRAQEYFNRLLTGESVATHFGAIRVPILRGRNWRNEDAQAGARHEITYDWTEAIEEPDDPLTPNNVAEKIRWGGPEIESVVRTLRDTAMGVVKGVAVSFGIDGRSVYSSNEPASGYSLQIEAAALKGKHAQTRTLAQRPLTRLAELIRLTWDAANPKRRFPAGTFPRVLIPDYGASVVSAEETQSDVAKLNAGIVGLKTLIIKHNPGIPAYEVDRMLRHAQRRDLRVVIRKLRPGLSAAEEDALITESLNEIESQNALTSAA